MSKHNTAFYDTKSMKWRRRAADAALSLAIFSTILMIVVPLAGE